MQGRFSWWTNAGANSLALVGAMGDGEDNLQRLWAEDDGDSGAWLPEPLARRSGWRGLDH